MRKWKSHKIVEAESIQAVREEFVGAILELPDDETFEVSDSVYRRIKDMSGGNLIGGYIVVYENDYISWSPPGAFIDGYTEVETDG